MTQVKSIIVNVNSREVGVNVKSRSTTLQVETKKVSVSCSKLNVKVTPTIVSPRVTKLVRAPIVRSVDLRVVTLAVPGPRGANGSGAITVPFEWNSITILPLLTAVAEKTVLRVEVCLVIPFDGTAPTLSVGDSLDHERLIPVIDIDPSLEATFSVNPGYRYSTATQINLYINSGSGASQGSGIVSIVMEQ